MKKILFTLVLVIVIAATFLFGNLFAVTHCAVSENGNMVELSIFNQTFLHELEEGENA